MLAANMSDNIQNIPSPGAFIRNEYVNRKQRIIAVNKADLEALQETNLLQAFTQSFGIFLMSGAFWILVQEAAKAGTLQFTAINGACAASIVVGAAFTFVGYRLWKMKNKRIDDMFEGWEPIDPNDIVNRS